MSDKFDRMEELMGHVNSRLDKLMSDNYISTCKKCDTSLIGINHKVRTIIRWESDEQLKPQIRTFDGETTSMNENIRSSLVELDVVAAHLRELIYLFDECGIDADSQIMPTLYNIVKGRVWIKDLDGRRTVNIDKYAKMEDINPYGLMDDLISTDRWGVHIQRYLDGLRNKGDN